MKMKHSAAHEAYLLASQHLNNTPGSFVDVGKFWAQLHGSTASHGWMSGRTGLASIQWVVLLLVILLLLCWATLCKRQPPIIQEVLWR
jgi:ABC-type multidrug transport system permease subunit